MLQAYSRSSKTSRRSWSHSSKREMKSLFEAGGDLLAVHIAAFADMWPKSRAGKRIVMSSIVGVSGFLGGSSYLTWWVLSWDIMEPLTYHIGLCVALTAGLYTTVMPKYSPTGIILHALP